MYKVVVSYITNLSVKIICLVAAMLTPLNKLVLCASGIVWRNTQDGYRPRCMQQTNVHT